MLLGLMRKHAGSWMIKVIMTVIVLVFIFYFGYSFKVRQGLKVAVVNGSVISRYEYSKAYRDLYEAFRRQYKDMWTDNMVKLFHLKELALDRLINQRLINDEAKKIGITVTDEEIQKYIMGIKAFESNGHFDMRRYSALLNSNHITPDEFEASIASDILRKKVRQFICTFVHVSDQEVRDHYTFLTEKRKVAFVCFAPETFKDKVKIKPDELKKFFEKNKEKYKTRKKIKLTYMVIDPKAFMKQVKVGEKEIEDYYEEYKSQFKDKGTDKPMPLDKVRERIKETLAREKALDMAQEHGLTLIDQMPYEVDLASYAKENGLKYGSTDFFSINEPIPGIGGNYKVKKGLFSLHKGETSGLVSINGKYYLFQVVEIKPPHIPEMKEVEDRVKKDFLKNLELKYAKDVAQKFLSRLKKGEKWDNLIKEYGVKSEESSFFSRQEQAPGVGAARELNESLFTLNKTRKYLDKPYLCSKGAFVYRWLASRGIDEEKFKKDKKKFTTMVVNQKRNFVFQKWLQHLKKVSDIKILTPPSEL